VQGKSQCEKAGGKWTASGRICDYPPDPIDVSKNPGKWGGVMGRPETMCPCTNVLGPLVPKLIVPCDTMSLD